MKWTSTKVRKALGGKLIGYPQMKTIVCETLLLLPSEMIEYICTKVWFLSSPEDAWAMTFRGSEIQDRHLIFLSDELISQGRKQITYTLLHELGHVLLNHRNSIGYKQTESEIKKQEVDADNFAKKYF